MAFRMRPKSWSLTGRDRSRPRTVAPSTAPVGVMVSMSGCPRQTRERRIEDFCRHHLTATDQSDLIWTIVGDRAVDRTKVVPDQQVFFSPMMRVTESRLQLEIKQICQQLIAFL